MSRTTLRPPEPGLLEVRRSARSSIISGIGGLVIVGVLVMMPFIAFQDTTNLLILFFAYMVMSSMWNLLAGFGGLVSIGQQAYVGIGAYSTFVFTQLGFTVVLAIVLGAATTAAISIPTSLLAFRLRGDYFAVGTWVIAEVYRIIADRWTLVTGGPSGVTFIPLPGLSSALRGAVIYWTALAVAALTVAGGYWLMRGKLGLALTAVRDSETTATAAGVNVGLAKRITYLVSAGGCGAAGGILLLTQLGAQPDAIFSVEWSAYMIFIVVIGGIGYLEGPIIGTIVFFILREALADYGSWYLVVLGVIAMASAIWLPNGLWGTITEKTGFRLFPVSYHVRGRGLF
jgi:branched-chain amino acid transport system permease protein